MAKFETVMLQVAVAVGSLVPIGAGAAGVIIGPAMLGDHTGAATDLDSHFRYLSGLLLGIGLGFASTVPQIEMSGRRFRLLTGIVVVGGVGRLISLLSIGTPPKAMLAALAMELVVTPLLAAWQLRVERKPLSAPWTRR